ncbi:MAG: HAMP domain-containing protein [Elusimicrobiota bacterium]
MANFKRKQVVVKHGFQFRYVLFVFLAVLFAGLLISWDVYYTMGRVMFSQVNHPEIYSMISKVNTQIISKLVLYLLLVIIVSIFVSHKIAGPLYRIEKSSEILGLGDLTHRVKLREGDELKDVAEKLNHMVEQLQTKVGENKNVVAECLEQLQHIEVLAQKCGGEHREILEKITSVKVTLQKINAGLKTSVTDTPQK